MAIDDLVVTLDGPEPPILDGDAQSYVALFDQAGLKETPGARRALKMKKRVTAEAGEAYAVLSPAETLSFDFDIRFASPAIGTQFLSWTFSTEGFRRDIAPARTFGFVSELETLNKIGPRQRRVARQHTRHRRR